MEMRNANKNIHTIPTPPPSLPFHKNKERDELVDVFERYSTAGSGNL